MRVLRVLVVALFGLFAMVAGLIMAAVVSLATALFVSVRRMLRTGADSRSPVGRRTRSSRSDAGEVIEVTATEVPVDSSSR